MFKAQIVAAAAVVAMVLIAAIAGYTLKLGPDGLEFAPPAIAQQSKQ